MIPWYLIPICLIVGIGLGYGFRGLISKDLRKIKDKIT